MVSARFVAPLLVMLMACQSAAEHPANGHRGTIRTSGPTGIAPASSHCDRSTVVEVSGRANIFGAGISQPPAPAGGGGGVDPVCVAVPPHVVVMVITHAEGSIAFTPLGAPDVYFHKCPGGREVVLDHGPEGSAGGCPGERPGGTISGAGVVSGIRSPDRAGYLIGVFLPDKITVGSPPENLDFTGNYDFLRLSPRLAQLFFIGDGRAGLRLQHFEIPAGATHLYLGIADAWGFRASPGYYDDNTGAFNLTVRFR
jgi:hypothetical protein